MDIYQTIAFIEMDSEDLLDKLKYIKKYFETESHLTMSYAYEIQSLAQSLKYLKNSITLLEKLLE